jgi:hypothetical protein
MGNFAMFMIWHLTRLKTWCVLNWLRTQHPDDYEMFKKFEKEWIDYLRKASFQPPNLKVVEGEKK